MKKLSVIILASIFTLASISCSKDDGDEETQLAGASWKLNQLLISGKDSTDTLSECDLLDTYTFKNDGSFVYEAHNEKDAGGCSEVISTGTWEADNSVEGSRKFDAKFKGSTDNLLFILEGDRLREDSFEDAPEGGTITFSYYYTRE